MRVMLQAKNSIKDGWTKLPKRLATLYHLLKWPSQLKQPTILLNTERANQTLYKNYTVTQCKQPPKEQLTLLTDAKPNSIALVTST